MTQADGAQGTRVWRRAGTFAAIAIVATWTPTAALLLLGGDAQASAGAFALWAVAGLGPALAATTMEVRGGGWPAARRLWAGLLRWRFGRGGWLLLAPLPLALAVLGVLVWQDRVPLEPAGPGFLLLVPVILLGGVAFGGLEEIGWRGYLQPLVQRRLAPLPAALAVGAVWAVWHAPLFLLTGSSQAAASVMWFTLGGLALAVLFAWAWNRFGQNLLLVVLLHGVLNGWASVVVTGLAPASRDAGFGDLFSVGAVVLAVLLVLRVGPDLGRPGR